MSALLCAAALVPPMPTDDAARLQGSWVCISVRGCGADMTGRETKSMSIVVRGNKITMKAEQTAATFKLHPTRKPKVIELTFISEGLLEDISLQGIYALRSDELRICVSVNDNVLPTQFTPGDNELLFTFRRQK
jgi:uncharacterized protein (TIGR03067 family)